MRGCLETFTPDNLSVSGTQFILQEKLVFEERKVRRNPEENHTKMDENDDLNNRVRIKMIKLNLVVVQESVEEIADRETKCGLEEGGKHHNLICIGCRNVLLGGRAPLHHRAI
jgi:hypothetical protein